MAFVMALSFMLPRFDFTSSRSSVGRTRWKVWSSSNREFSVGAARTHTHTIFLNVLVVFQTDSLLFSCSVKLDYSNLTLGFIDWNAVVLAVDATSTASHVVQVCIIITNKQKTAEEVETTGSVCVCLCQRVFVLSS